MRFQRTSKHLELTNNINLIAKMQLYLFKFSAYANYKAICCAK